VALVSPLGAGFDRLRLAHLRRRFSSVSLLFSGHGALFAWVLLGEALVPLQIAGGAVVLIGIYLAGAFQLDDDGLRCPDTFRYAICRRSRQPAQQSAARLDVRAAATRNHADAAIEHRCISSSAMLPSRCSHWKPGPRPGGFLDDRFGLFRKDAGHMPVRPRR